MDIFQRGTRTRAWNFDLPVRTCIMHAIHQVITARYTRDRYISCTWTCYLCIYRCGRFNVLTYWWRVIRQTFEVIIYLYHPHMLYSYSSICGTAREKLFVRQVSDKNVIRTISNFFFLPTSNNIILRRRKRFNLWKYEVRRCVKCLKVTYIHVFLIKNQVNS